jgi:Flp pilus assembly protein TadD
VLGSILEKQGDKRGAANEYRTALSLARDFGKARAGLKRVQ